jgi:SAM-dependent methyltransferase
MPSDALPLPGSRDFSRRAQLTELMDEPCTRDELRACLRDVTRLNRWFFAHRPLFQFLDSCVPSPIAEPLHILDVGCGDGDALRRIERWAAQRNLAVDLTGLDINPDAVAIAAELTPPSSRIRWIACDIFAYKPDRPIDLVISTIFTHHLDNPNLIRFIGWMEQQARLGWFINDLSRAPIPYHLLRIFTKLARLHPFVQHDGPVSIARAFVPEDWQRLCAAAGLDMQAVSIQPFTPARLCVARRKS